MKVETVSEPNLSEALNLLDAGCGREEWLTIIAAAKKAGMLESDVISWSRRGANFTSERDVVAAWRGFKWTGRVDSSSLIDIVTAKQNTTASSPHRIRRRVRMAAGVQPSQSMSSLESLATIFSGYEEATATHQYIARKKGSPDGLRQVANDSTLRVAGVCVAGWLAIPVRSSDGCFKTIQYISPLIEDTKLSASGGKFDDGMFVVGTIAAGKTVFVCEGIGHAWSCHKADLAAAAVVAFGSARLSAVAKIIMRLHPAAIIVLVADRGVEAKVEEIACELGCAWVRMPESKPKNYDVNDYEADHGVAAVSELLSHPHRPKMRYRIISGPELLRQPSLRWLVRGVIPEKGLCALFGPSASGKSFLVLDLCMAVARGASWFGRRVNAASVTYVSLEGEAGVSKRTNAWCIAHNCPFPERLGVVMESLDLRNDADTSQLIASLVSRRVHDGLLVIDTLNRAAPGADENASADMGEILQACNRLQNALGGVVLLVHHTGKDTGKGMRGHSSLFAALDAAIEVHGTSSQRAWSVAKSKDDAAGQRFGFRLETVELGVDEGEAVTSCVVRATGSSVVRTASTRTPSGSGQRVAFDEVIKRLRESPVGLHLGAPAGVHCMTLSAAIDLAAEKLKETCAVGRQRFLAGRAIDSMVKNGLFTVQNGLLWRSETD